jgi:hypothetical protein
MTMSPHWIIEARPTTTIAGPVMKIEGHAFQTVAVPTEARGTPLSVTFDEVAERLIESSGVYWEPDGSFAWTEPGPPRIRLHGQLADGGTHLQHIELWGVPSTPMLDRLLEFTCGDTGLMFQLVRTGVYVDETALRKFFLSVV